MFVLILFVTFVPGNSSTQFNYIKIMTNKKYLKKCLEFDKIVRDIAFGEVIECSANALTVRVFDDDLVYHDIVVAKTTFKLLSSIVNDYLACL